MHTLMNSTRIDRVVTDQYVKDCCICFSSTNHVIVTDLGRYIACVNCIRDLERKLIPPKKPKSWAMQRYEAKLKDKFFNIMIDGGHGSVIERATHNIKNRKD